MQEALRATPETLPGGQPTGAVLPVLHELPAGQMLHSSTIPRLGVADHVPAGHGIPAAEFAGQ